MNNSKSMSLFDIDKKLENTDETLVDKQLEDINKLTFEDALTTVMTDQKEIGVIISEITRVESEIVSFQAGDLDTIHVDEELTTEMSLADLAKLSYMKMSKDKDKILERAFQYIRTLINKAITFIKSAMTKYLAVHSKHIEISKELIAELANIDLKDLPANDDISIYGEIGVILNNNNVLTSDALYFINNPKAVSDVIDKIHVYGNHITVIRPEDKVILNTLRTEIGNARADIMRVWNEGATSKFIELFVNTPIHKLLTESVRYTELASEVDVDLNNTSNYTPISTDGNIITCLYRTEDHQLRIFRTVIKQLPTNVATVNMEKLPEIVTGISNTDLGRLVKDDIKILGKIEKEAKVYFSQIKDELGADRGKRNASFNNTVTMINSALAIANNRMKLTNNLISSTEKIIKKYGA